jgi:hypothetical protein
VGAALAGTGSPAGLGASATSDPQPATAARAPATTDLPPAGSTAEQPRRSALGTATQASREAAARHRAGDGAPVADLPTEAGTPVTSPAPRGHAASRPDAAAPSHEPDPPRLGTGDGAALSVAGSAGFSGVVALAAALALLASALYRRLTIVGERWTAVAFVSALERPG